MTITTIEQKVLLFPRDCITCDGPNCTSPNPSKRCSRCHTVYYCGASCQKKHWKNHKPYCLDINTMRQQVDLKSFSNEIASPDVTPINTECCICLADPIQEPVTLKSCKHAFCYGCLIEWQRYGENQTCPSCRGETENVEDATMERARLLGGRANRWDIEKRFDEANEVRRQAIKELEMIIDQETEPHLQALITAGEILLKFDAQRALETFDRVIRADNERRERARRVEELMAKLEKQRAIGTIDTKTEATLDELLSGKYSYSLLPGTGPTRHVFVHLFRAEAFERMNKWNEAKDTYMSLLKLMESHEDSTPPEQRAVFMGLSRCAYYLGVYDKSIAGADAALEMNRHFPDVHKYKALSLKAQGKLEEAVMTMNRAVLYETPWDDRHRAEVIAMYEELKQELDSKVE